MKSKILKILSLICALCLIISLAGCGKEPQNETSKDNESEPTSSLVSSTESEEQISGGGG